VKDELEGRSDAPRAAQIVGFEPCGLVTLLTDFGTSDTFVGVMKGVLWGRSRRLRAAIDLTHAIAAQDVEDAALHLAEARPWFPAGTVHVAVVDPGVGSSRAILAALDGGHLFLAPDNGLLTPVLGAGARVWRVDPARFGLTPPSRTFHGRDVFAPVAAALVDGCDPSSVGLRAEKWQVLPMTAPQPLGAGRVRGQIRRVDRFGNLISNLDADGLERLRGELAKAPRAQFQVRVGEVYAPLVDTYADAAKGAPLALLNSSGWVEVAVRDGDAARLLGVSRGAPIVLEPVP